MGTALTQEHIDMLKRYNTRQVIVFLDGDEAGIKATRSASKLLYDNNIATYVVNVSNKDPDEIANKYKKQTFSYINSLKKLWWKHELDIIQNKYMEKIYDIRLGFKDEIAKFKQNINSDEIICEILNIEKEMLKELL
jgi:DNA primase